jgi:cell division protein FtsQ
VARVWHNPRLLNLAAGFLVGLAALVFAIVAAQLVLRSSLFPVREIRLVGELRHTSREALEKAARGSIAGNLLATELDALRAALQALPWVRRASVRRVWPDRLEVALEEHVALARWGDEGLVNTHGEPFAGKATQALPTFVGPAGTSAEMARRYARFAALLAPLGSELQRIVLTSRYGWQLQLASGLQIMLGRDADAGEARLARFVQAYPATLAAEAMRGARYGYVDLRYPNGFALRLQAASG